MPTAARIIAGPRNTSFDRYVSELVQEEGYGAERQYFGITGAERADEVRRKMRRAGMHLGISVKAFWKECTGCPNGGADCRYHVYYTAYDPTEARRYKESQTRSSRPKGRR